MSQQQLNDVLSQFIAIAIPVLTALVSYLSYMVAKWIKAKTEEVKASVGSDNWDLIVSYGRLAVKTAEQLGITGQIENTGKAKKTYVEGMIQQFLDQRGLHVSVIDLEGLIESAVKDGVHKDWDSSTILSVTQAPVIATGVPPVEPTTTS